MRSTFRQHCGHQWRQVDHQQASQNQHPLSGETDGRTLADYRPLQAPTGRQTGVRQDALDLWSLGLSKNYWSMCKKLKTVMTACGIEKSISYHCGRHSFATLALSKGMPIESVSRVFGAFKGYAHRECESCIRTHEHRHDTDLCKKHIAEIECRPDDVGWQAQCFVQKHQVTELAECKTT